MKMRISLRQNRDDSDDDDDDDGKWIDAQHHVKRKHKHTGRWCVLSKRLTYALITVIIVENVAA